MKKSWLAGVALGGGCLILYLLLHSGGQSPEPASITGSAPAEVLTPEATGGASARPAPVMNPTLVAATTPATAISAASGPASASSVKDGTHGSGEKGNEASPATVVEQTRRVITQYNSMFGENPVGTNQEITRALQGKNPRQINFIEDAAAQINSKGEWVDPWGSPYFFHQLSATQMEVRSAGPDKIMWNEDDVVAR